jgi:hypothetical protein
VRLRPSPKPLIARTSRDPSRDFRRPTVGNLVVSGSGARAFFLSRKALVFPGKIGVVGGKSSSKLSASSQEGSLQGLDDSPVSVELHPVCSETQFDRVLAEAQQLEELVIFVWYGVLILCLKFWGIFFFYSILVGFLYWVDWLRRKNVGKGKGMCQVVVFFRLKCSV